MYEIDVLIINHVRNDKRIIYVHIVAEVYETGLFRTEIWHFPKIRLGSRAKIGRHWKCRTFALYVPAGGVLPSNPMGLCCRLFKLTQTWPLKTRCIQRSDVREGESTA